jgi:hydroxymethylbilane synthase
MSKSIRIGTRDSELALWQAHTVQNKLEDLGYKTEIIAVKSQGDIILDKPLYELGITGIFTKTLDLAMINGQVDIAVHSMKDVPTALPQGIVQAAVLERANVLDILVHKGNLDFLISNGTIATGSLRRQAQWLHRHPNHKVVDLRGNVNTRMQKLKDNDWNGAVFAAAGLERVGAVKVA